MHEIRDVYGRRIEYSYVTEFGTEFSTPPGEQPEDRECTTIQSQPQCTEVDVAISEIGYNFVNSVAQTVIQFNYGLAEDWPNEQVDRQEAFMTAGRFRPQFVEIKQGGARVSRYNFTYFDLLNDPNDPDHQGLQDLGEHYIPSPLDTHTQFWMLGSITPAGKNLGTLPATTFDYGYDTACNNNASGQSYCVSRLTRVDNGYGGVTELAYGAIGAWHYVTEVYTWDGVQKRHGVHAQAHTRQSYTRSDPCYDKTDNNTNKACHLGNAPPTGALVGFRHVTVATKAPNASGAWDTVSQQQLEFVRGAIGDYWLNGKTKNEKFQTASGTTLMERKYNWQHDLGDDQLQDEEIIWYNNDGTNPLSRKTIYTYYDDPVATNDQEFGGLRQVQEQDESGTLRRCTVYVYAHRKDVDENNASDPHDDEVTLWLVNRPLRETTFDGSCSSTASKLTETLYRYAGSTNPQHTILDDKAQLTWILQLVTRNPDTYISEKRLYTANGLLQERHSFYSTSSTTVYPTDLRNKIVYTYNNNSLGLPLTMTNQGGTGSPSLTETYTYDSTFFWLVVSATKPDGATTQYAHDQFSRLLKVAYPGDNINTSPTITYSYWDTGSVQFLQPFLVGTTYKNQILEDERHLYDGLGRLVQTQQARYDVHAVGERDVLVTYQYDARGLLVCQTAPFLLNSYVYNSQTPVNPYRGNPCDHVSQTATQTTYDVLGRPRTVTNPADETTTYEYFVQGSHAVNDAAGVSHNNFLLTTITNPKHYVVNHFHNVFGELVLVRELIGNTEATYDHYADTFYRYDDTGHLLQVQTKNALAAGTNPEQQPTLRTTTMSYDLLGRKLAMNDPDMGDWFYTYTTTGQVRRQQDARGIVLCYYYDPLDRLQTTTRDIAPQSSCPSTPDTNDTVLATYTYDDTATNGEGKPARVGWAPNTATNYETFAYDVEGRLKTHSRVINDSDPYTLSIPNNGYDLLDRPLKINTPFGELLTLTYDHEGEDSLKAGNQTLINNPNGVGWTALGQLAYLARPGTKPDSAFGYYTAADNNARLSLIRHGSSTIGGDALPDFSYTSYDDLGQITTMQIALSGSAAQTQSFSYDALNRLSTAALTGSGSYDHEYSYDKLGNMTNRNQAARIYHHDDPNHVHAVSEVEGDLIRQFTYDANGNMIWRDANGTEWDYQFDAQNRLFLATKEAGANDEETHFFYDATGQRIRAIYPDGSEVHTPSPTMR